jgi:hypothetical protein
MPIPLGGSYSLAVTEPIDSRTSVSTFSQLNNIQNKYPGLITYVIDEKNLYVFQNNNIWEKIVTNNVDNLVRTSNFDFDETVNGQVISVDSITNVTAKLSGQISNYPIGFNVTFIQENLGNITFGVNTGFVIVNRLNLNKTAGRYAVASLLRLKDTGLFILYGDLI